jgi:hypothetical protein
MEFERSVIINGQPFICVFDENGLWKESIRPGQKKNRKP